MEEGQRVLLCSQVAGMEKNASKKLAQAPFNKESNEHHNQQQCDAGFTSGHHRRIRGQK
jgi:hypothetical protein